MALLRQCTLLCKQPSKLRCYASWGVIWSLRLGHSIIVLLAFSVRNSGFNSQLQVRTHIIQIHFITYPQASCLYRCYPKKKTDIRWKKIYLLLTLFTIFHFLSFSKLKGFRSEFSARSFLLGVIVLRFFFVSLWLTFSTAFLD